MKRALVLAVLCLAGIASAAPSHVLVLRAEGTADTASRTSIDTHVLRLAKNIEGKVEVGDITLTEAAAAVGCNPTDTSCKDEVLTTLGVDEIVTTTVTATPSGLNITVRRIARSNARAAQTTIVSARSPDAKITSDIGPLFGVVAAALPPEPKPVADAKPAPPPPAPTVAKGTAPSPSEPSPLPPPAPVGDDKSSDPIDSRVTAAPTGAIETQPAPEGSRNRRLQKIGMGVGGAFILIGFLMWSQAGDIEDQIADKPDPRTAADFAALRDLEKRGDDIAGAGNLFFLTGAVAGGISGYLFWRGSNSTTTQTARIAPAAVPGGAGVTLTFGGMR